MRIVRRLAFAPHQPGGPPGMSAPPPNEEDGVLTTLEQLFF